MKQSQQLVRPLVLTDIDVVEDIACTKMIVEKDDHEITITLVSPYVPDMQGESIILSMENAMKLTRYLNRVLYGK